MWKRMWKRASRWLASMRKQPRPDKALQGSIEPDETQDMPALRIEKAPEPADDTPIELDAPVTPDPPGDTSIQSPQLPAPTTEPVLDTPPTHEQPGTPDSPLPFPRNDEGEFDYDAVKPGVSYYTPSSPSSQTTQDEPTDVDRWTQSMKERASITEAHIDKIMSSSENDEQLPMTNRVRVPPELEGESLPQPPPGLQLTPGDRSQAQPTESPASPAEKPATEQQSDQLIQLITEQTRVLESIRDGQAAFQTALENLATALENSGGVV